MNRTRLMFIGLIALALGGLLSSVVYKRLKEGGVGARKPGVDIVVAANDLQVGTKLEDRDLKLVNFPAESLPDGIIRQKARAVGRGVLQPISRGEFILSSKLADKDVAGLPALIPPGMRALSVRVNDVISVAGFVLPGTRVDVLLTGNPGAGGESVTTTVLENVAVLATGQKLERNAAGEPQSTPVITLLVSPEDAQKLTLASQEGRIQLSLRNPLDTGQEKISSVRNAGLYGAIPAAANTAPRTPTKVKHVAPSPAPSRPSPYTIEIIRGNEKKEVNFAQ
jgi:pilus assembly protein CpaB